MRNLRVLLAAIFVAMFLAGCGGTGSDGRKAAEDRGPVKAESAEVTADDTADSDDEGPLEEPFADEDALADATCTYVGTGGRGRGSMEVELEFRNPFGDVDDIEVTYALFDADGMRFATETADGLSGFGGFYFPAESEIFHVVDDTREEVPSSIDESQIECSVLEMDDTSWLSAMVRADADDSCEIAGIDSSGRVDMDLIVTSPYDTTTKVQVWWGLYSSDGARIATDTRVEDAIGAGETFRISSRYGVDVPDQIAEESYTCKVVGFWDQDR